MYTRLYLVFIKRVLIVNNSLQIFQKLKGMQNNRFLFITNCNVFLTYLLHIVKITH
jgi:hypothetical protein